MLTLCLFNKNFTKKTEKAMPIEFGELKINPDPTVVTSNHPEEFLLQACFAASALKKSEPALYFLYSIPIIGIAAFLNDLTNREHGVKCANANVRELVYYEIIEHNSRIFAITNLVTSILCFLAAFYITPISSILFITSAISFLSLVGGIASFFNFKEDKTNLEKKLQHC